VLRFIAILKFGKAALLLAVGLGAIRLLNPEIADRAQGWATALAASSDRQMVQHLLARAVSLRPARLEALGVGAFLYAGLFATEGVGLWRAKRWAEYLTIIATASFIPFEGFEFAQRATLLRGGALVLNIAVVAYLVAHVRRDRSVGSPPRESAA
jgi:uncharacterized membrane protein (DUF2068 family)